MARRNKGLSRDLMDALAAHSDAKVHEIWGAIELARSDVEVGPTLDQISAFVALSAAYSDLAHILLSRKRMEAREGEIERKYAEAAALQSRVAEPAT